MQATAGTRADIVRGSCVLYGRCVIQFVKCGIDINDVAKVEVHGCEIAETEQGAFWAWASCEGFNATSPDEHMYKAAESHGRKRRKPVVAYPDTKWPADRRGRELYAYKNRIAGASLFAHGYETHQLVACVLHRRVHVRVPAQACACPCPCTGVCMSVSLHRRVHVRVPAQASDVVMDVHLQV
jgi:hypothetical protein